MVQDKSCTWRLSCRHEKHRIGGGRSLHFYIYLRLIVLTAGTLLPFFWIVVILGHRRQRNFERIFFFLCLSMVCIFGASLLALNAQLYYATNPPGLATFSWMVLCLGLWFLPALLLHLHVEYAQVREMLPPGGQKWLWLVAAYAPAILLSPMLYGALRLRSGYNFLLPSNALGTCFQIWLVGALTISAVWQWRFGRAAPDEEQKSFHRALRFNLGLIAVWMALLHFVFPRLGKATEQNGEFYITIVGLVAVAPLVALIRKVQRFNFLQIGRQRNLIYAVFSAFVALLYFSLIRRISLWLEPYVPPEASAAILLFLPVVLFEPLQRLMGRILRRTAQAEMDHAQRLMGPIQEVARLGNLGKLTAFIEKWISEQLQLAEAKLFLDGASDPELMGKAAEEVFSIRQPGHPDGTLRVKPHGAMLSGETAAALEFLCEQLPGALDLCRLIEEKLQLERELAERERLAALGQMAASISHNLKNPLGSMKTILQVQLENPEMPESMRAETKMILEEIGRLSVKLNQLLQFSRPTVIGEGKPAKCDASEVAREVVSVLRPEAQRKGVALEISQASTAVTVAIGMEALNDILTNLVVNALDAAARSGHVIVQVSRKDGNGLLAVEDDGPGVPAELREKIVQPFFTTKTQGTGLGLAIVARRASEAGGKLELESPVKNGRGTRFLVWLSLGEETR
jgi:signal transduction histidine kinase